MKVLHIISSGGMYGAEAVILNLSRALNESHHSSVIGVFANSSNPNFQLHEAAAKENISSELIPCSGLIDKTTVAAIRALAMRTGAQVVHAHGYKADVYVYLALRSESIPFISTCHSWLNSDVVAMLYGLLDRLVLRKYAAVVAVSDELKLKLYRAGIKKDKVHFVRNGIDLRPFTNAMPSLRKSKSGLTVGWIARLSREKGSDIFLKAVVKVLAIYPETQFVMVGDGPDRSMLEQLVGELGIKDSVSLIGRREDMPSVYASLDIMVSSSRQEGLPMAILEGMGSKLPVVATMVGNVPNVIQDGVNGLLVPSEDVKSLAEGIIRLLEDEELRRRLGSEARRRVESEFSADRLAEAYMKIYNEVTEDKSASLSTGPANLKEGE